MNWNRILQGSNEMTNLNACKVDKQKLQLAHEAVKTKPPRRRRTEPQV